MSRTKRKPYTKSKKLDRTCRNHGSCPYCRDNRLHSRRKASTIAKEKTND